MALLEEQRLRAEESQAAAEEQRLREKAAIAAAAREARLAAEQQRAAAAAERKAANAERKRAAEEAQAIHLTALQPFIKTSSLTLHKGNTSSVAEESFNPRKALVEAERRAIRKREVEISERNAGLENYGATRATRKGPPSLPWQACRANTSGFGSNESRFAGYWRAPAHMDQTPHVGGPAAYDQDAVGHAHPAPTVYAAAATSMNPFRYGETNGLTYATSVGKPEINDWWCDVGKPGCLRPTAKASHGGAYEEGGFWYRNNLCVCQACYDSAHAEDQHGSRSLPQTESWLPEGWLLSDLHKYLGFVGKQRRGQQVGQQREEAERQRDAIVQAHRDHGEDVRHGVLESRAATARAREEARQSKAAPAEALRRDKERRQAEARALSTRRLEHAMCTVGEVHGHAPEALEVS